MGKKKNEEPILPKPLPSHMHCGGRVGTSCPEDMSDPSLVITDQMSVSERKLAWTQLKERCPYYWDVMNEFKATGRSLKGTVLRIKFHGS